MKENLNWFVFGMNLSCFHSFVKTQMVEEIKQCCPLAEGRFQHFFLFRSFSFYPTKRHQVNISTIILVKGWDDLAPTDGRLGQGGFFPTSFNSSREFLWHMLPVTVTVQSSTLLWPPMAAASHHRHQKPPSASTDQTQLLRKHHLFVAWHHGREISTSNTKWQVVL